MTYNNILLVGPVLVQAVPTNISVEQTNGKDLFVVLTEVSEEGYPQCVVFNVNITTITALERAVEILRDNIPDPGPQPSVN